MTQLGYFVEVLYQMAAADAYYIAHGSILLLFISICWHHQAFEQMIRHSMEKFDLLENHHKEPICKVIRFHVTVKE